ncbi:11S globulin seed storage protein Jug r 4-like [Bidens hawaiensis]|uniref:11S globulin seed storage protein Jug r 4-like n=1 Tax=Bidens hawaiensis TaxID=980011 RepID=UPI0040498126
MAKLFVSLSFLLLIHGCLAFQRPFTFQQQNQCQIQQINALVPVERVQSEGGFTEFFNSEEQQFQCAGVEVIRHQIRPRGLLLPSYANSPILFFVEQGSGFQGVMLPGCPETFEVSTEQFEGRKVGSSFTDRHQKIEHFQQGDVVAIPTGAAHWLYNDGQSDLVIIALLDTTNNDNQLDSNHRRFFLAGSSQGEQIQQTQQSSWQRPTQQGQSQQTGADNIFKAFPVEIIASVFNVDQETAQLLKSENDQRGHIVLVEGGMQVIQPPFHPEEKYYDGLNGLEETICSLKLRMNINDPSKADFYNPQAGQSTNLNSFKFPVLKELQLSVERGVLNRFAIVSPYWIPNAHNILYVTNGDMRIQIVNDQGMEVFNDQVYQQQLVVIPQGFAVVKQAGEQGCMWISFRTNDNSVINTLAGKNSVMRALPLDVIAYSYQLSREDAQKLKYNRRESVMFEHGQTSYQRVPPFVGGDQKA